MTSTFGVGADFDERLLASMARAGGGHFYFIEHPRQILDVLTGELGEALEIVARRAVVEIELPHGVEAELLNDLRSDAAGGRLRVELDDLVSNQDVSFVVKLGFPHGEPGNRAALRAMVSSEDGRLDGRAEIVWTFADHAANDSQPRNRSVDRIVAEIYAARARRDAIECNRAGDYDHAMHILTATRKRILSYAGSDETLRHIAEGLGQEESVYGAPLTAMALKAAHWDSVSWLRMRTRDGKARRAPR